MYIMVSAIFDVLKNVIRGLKKRVFLIVFGVDRKSPWSYIYKHLSDFRVWKSFIFHIFSSVDFGRFFNYGRQNGLRMRIRL